MRMPLETGSAASPVRLRSSCDVEIIYDKYSTGSWVAHTQQGRMVGDFGVGVDGWVGQVALFRELSKH